MSLAEMLTSGGFWSLLIFVARVITPKGYYWLELKNHFAQSIHNLHQCSE